MKNLMNFLVLVTLLGLANSAIAHCTSLQNVTICDNGDIEIERSDGVYTLLGRTLIVERFDAPYYQYPYDYRNGYSNSYINSYFHPITEFGAESATSIECQDQLQNTVPNACQTQQDQILKNGDTK